MNTLAQDVEREVAAILATVAGSKRAGKLARNVATVARTLVRMRAHAERTDRDSRATLGRMEAQLRPVLSVADHQRLQALLERIVAETRPNFEGRP
jgi:hypothetical protein